MTGRLGDAEDGWRGSYDGWKAGEQRDVPNAGPVEACRICGCTARDATLTGLACHTAQERDAHRRAGRTW